MTKAEQEAREREEVWYKLIQTTGWHWGEKAEVMAILSIVLDEAERRGMERAAKIADKLQPDADCSCAAAIRREIGAEKGGAT